MKAGSAVMFSLLVFCTALGGCRRREAGPGRGTIPGAVPARSREAGAAAQSRSIGAGSPGPAVPVAAAAPAVRAVSMPFDYPAVPTTAQEGDFVLAPPREWIDRAGGAGGAGQTFIFYGAKMLQTGPTASRIRTLLGRESLIPNALIIPLGRGEPVHPGDVVLTVWQSRSGMQRAIIVKGGTPSAPAARYLDLAWDSPERAALRVEMLRPGTYRKLKGGWEPGVSVAVRQGDQHRHGILVHAARAKERILVIGFAGRISVHSMKDAVHLPLDPGVRAAEPVLVPHLGSFVRVRVDRVDSAAGRLFVSFTFAAKRKELVIGYTNAIPSLPSM